uniref:Uncharacterized protein n=1 Tax=Panagrellus redivivus TaxID=6233 RepID=A0A7E5A014_PANRE
MNETRISTTIRSQASGGSNVLSVPLGPCGFDIFIKGVSDGIIKSELSLEWIMLIHAIIPIMLVLLKQTTV